MYYDVDQRNSCQVTPILFLKWLLVVWFLVELLQNYYISSGLESMFRTVAPLGISECFFENQLTICCWCILIGGVIIRWLKVLAENLVRFVLRVVDTGKELELLETGNLVVVDLCTKCCRPEGAPKRKFWTGSCLTTMKLVVECCCCCVLMGVSQCCSAVRPLFDLIS